MGLQQLPEEAILALVILAFSFGWCSVLLVLSRIAGWRRLAERYPCSAPIAGRSWWFQSAGIRCYLEANYGNCLTVTVNDGGLGLAILFPFRIGHPPLFIPWSEVEVSEVKRLFFLRRVRLTFPEEPSIWIEISTGLARKIQAAIGQDWFGPVA